MTDDTLTPARRFARFVSRLTLMAVAAFAGGWLDSSGFPMTGTALHLLAGLVGFIAILDS